MESTPHPPQQPGMDVTRAPQKSAIPSSNLSAPQPPAGPLSPKGAAPAPVHPPAAHVPLTVREAPKDNAAEPLVEKTPASPARSDPAQPQTSPKSKPPTGVSRPIGVIVVTILMMVALSVIAVAIYLKV